MKGFQEPTQRDVLGGEAVAFQIPGLEWGRGGEGGEFRPGVGSSARAES